MSTPSRSFGEVLRYYRLSRHLTQLELAGRAELSLGAINSLERGVRRAPYSDTIARLARALDLSQSEYQQLKACARAQAIPSPYQITIPALLQGDQELPPLVGRTRELARLARHLAGERPPILLLTGEPGIGKTRLLQEAALRAETLGLTILSGGCRRFSAREPYAPLGDALADWLAEQTCEAQRRALQGCSGLVLLLPELAERGVLQPPQGVSSSGQERRLLIAAVQQLLRNIGGTNGVLLLLDDVQWAGADALDLLLALAKEGNTSNLRVIGAYRNTELAQHSPLGVALGDLTHNGLLAQITLGPLEASEATTLVTSLLKRGGREADGAVRRLTQRADGVPFFLVSLAQSWNDNSRDDTIPANIIQSLSQRLSLLNAPAREMLEMAALMGQPDCPYPWTTVARRVGYTDEVVMGALEAAVAAGLLMETEMGLWFTHSLMRDVVLTRLNIIRRQMLYHRWQVAQTTRPNLGVLGEEAISPKESSAWSGGQKD